MSTKLATGDLSSALPIGSISFLGLFFILDHFMNLWIFLEGYTGTTTWNIILAIPTLVIMYIIGIINLRISDHIFSKAFKKDPTEELKLFLNIVAMKNNALTERYFEIKRLKEFFQACFFAFIILGFGTILTYKWAGNYEIFTFILGSGLIIIGISCPFLAKDYYNQLIKLVELAKTEFSS